MDANIIIEEQDLPSWRSSRADSIRTMGATAKTRIGLLTPYTGGNYGDGAIQEALIHNIRERIPKCAIHGITMHPKDTKLRHRIPAHPLSATPIPFFQTTVSQQKRREDTGSSAQHRMAGRGERLKTCLSQVRPLFITVRAIYRIFGIFKVELRHWARALRVVRRLDLLVVAGGGQLDEEWGGPWGHPYALFKWSLAAKLTNTPVAFMSVGACRLNSRWTRLFLKTALAIAANRSYRDERSKQLVATFRLVQQDKVVPDLAFSLPQQQVPPILSLPNQRGVVGIAPIAYCRPGSWPTANASVYNRYIRLLARFVSSLVRDGYTVVLFYSNSNDRRPVDEVFNLLDADLSPTLLLNVARPFIRSVQELCPQIKTFDYVVASRLHATLLSHAACKPVLAISFDPKVDTHMSDLGQRSYCLDIHHFELTSLLDTFDNLQAHRLQIQNHLQCLLPLYQKALQLQYDRVFGGISHVP